MFRLGEGGVRLTIRSSAAITSVLAHDTFRNYSCPPIRPKRFADTINASIPATNVATAQRRLPLPPTLTSAPFLRSDRRDGTPLAARISSRPKKLLRYPELFRCPIARVYQGKGWLYIRCRGKDDPLYAARRYEIILFLTA